MTKPRLFSLLPGYKVVSKPQMTEAAFAAVLSAIIEGFSDLFAGEDSADASWEYVQGVDHSIACLTAQRYGVAVETGAATAIMKLDKFVSPTDRHKLVAEFIAKAKRDELG